MFLYSKFYYILVFHQTFREINRFYKGWKTLRFKSLFPLAILILLTSIIETYLRKDRKV